MPLRPENVRVEVYSFLIRSEKMLGKFARRSGSRAMRTEGERENGKREKKRERKTNIGNFRASSQL